MGTKSIVNIRELLCHCSKIRHYMYSCLLLATVNGYQ